MEISFTDAKTQRDCTSETAMKRRWGAQQAKKLRQRLAELLAAASLGDIMKLPGPRLHPMKGDRKGQLSIDLVHPHRLLFLPDHDPLPKAPDGGLDYTQVTRITIIEVADTH